jgi:hypothetical protein
MPSLLPVELLVGPAAAAAAAAGGVHTILRVRRLQKLEGT